MRRLCAVLLAATLLLCALCSCGDPVDDDEQPPEQMQCASTEGSLYRLYLPVDWNLMTNAGISGGYYSMFDSATIIVHTYPNADNRTPATFWTEIMLPELADVYGGVIAVDEGDPVDALLGKEEYAVAATAVRYQGTREHTDYRAMAYLAPMGEQMLVLTYLSPIDYYETYLPAMEAAVTNFRMTDKPYKPAEPVHTVDPDAVEAPAGMKLASNDDVAYRLFVPESWVLDTALPTSSAYVSESDRSNVNVTVYMPEQDLLTAEQYWEMCLADLQGDDPLESVIRNMEVLSTTKGELGGRPANTYVYRGEVAGKTYRFSQTIAAYRGMVYTLTYTAADDTFETHLDALAQMIEAFEFRGNQ